jgi:arsenate reductase (thioredoxin)
MEKEKVLFLCTGNSCRSQMAEGYLRYLADDRFEAFSAGTAPTNVNPITIQVMKEGGIDIASHTSKSVSGFQNKVFDYVITVCDNAKQVCPVFPGKYKKIHWSIEDPAEFSGIYDDKLKLFRKTRDTIKQFVLDFINNKGPA